MTETLEKAWPLAGYAPGNYHCKCVTCETVFEGDKRAVMCLECAVRSVNRSLAATRPPLPADADGVRERDEKICFDRAMQQWEASLKRPDLSERDRVGGALKAYERQAFALSLPMSATRIKSSLIRGEGGAETYNEFVRAMEGIAAQTLVPMHLRGGFETEHGQFNSRERAQVVLSHATFTGTIGEVLPDGEADFVSDNGDGMTVKWRFFRKLVAPTSDPKTFEEAPAPQEGGEAVGYVHHDHVDRLQSGEQKSEQVTLFREPPFRELKHHFTALYAHPAPSTELPEGWIAVPREPTEAMEIAALTEWLETRPRYVPKLPLHDRLRRVLRRALAVIPTPNSDGGKAK